MSEPSALQDPAPPTQEPTVSEQPPIAPRAIHRSPVAPHAIDPAVLLPPARCADGTGTLISLFFSDDPVDIARAKAICRRCDRREPCLDAALSRGEPAGVWGGELLSGGVVVALKRPCGRPPKHPRPQLFVDELGRISEDPGSTTAVPVFAAGRA